MKSGRSDRKKAVSSHTASLAGNDDVYSAAFKQGNIIRATDNETCSYREGLLQAAPAPKAGRPDYQLRRLVGRHGDGRGPFLRMRLARFGAWPERQAPVNTPRYDGRPQPRRLHLLDDPGRRDEHDKDRRRKRRRGAFIVVLQTEILKEYVAPLKAVDCKGKPVLACVACKEFVTEDVVAIGKGGHTRLRYAGDSSGCAVSDVPPLFAHAIAA